MTRPQVLLFDLGKVLVGYDWTASLARLADRLAGVSVPDIVEWMHGPDGPHDPYCVGAIDDARLLEAIHARFDPERRLSDAWLVRLWCDMFDPWPEAFAVVDRLRGQAALGLVSNTNHLHFETLDRQLDLRGRFDHVTVSHEVGALKPDAAIYTHALGAFGVDGEQAWFTDDLPENVAGAERLGLRAHLFRDVPTLRTELRGLGFDVD